MDQYELYLCHHGVKGMKWGVRKARQLVGTSRRFIKKASRQAYKVSRQVSRASTRLSSSYANGFNKNNQYKSRASKAKKAVKVGAAVAGTVLAAYGAKKVHDLVRYKNTLAHIDRGVKSVEVYLNVNGPRSDYGPDVAGKLYRESWKAARSMAKNDSFGTALKNVARYEIERRTGRR